MKTTTLPAGEFKAKCLNLMDEVHVRHITFIITKHGKPIAKLVPIDDAPRDYFGCMKGTASVEGDIISPIDTHWESNE